MHRPRIPPTKTSGTSQSSANRAAELVRKLLASRRKQTLQIDVFNLGELLRHDASLLKTQVGEKIDLKISRRATSGT